MRPYTAAVLRGGLRRLAMYGGQSVMGPAIVAGNAVAKSAPP